MGNKKSNKNQLRLNTSTAQNNVGIEITARGIQPQVDQVSFQDLEVPSISGKPVDGIVVGTSFTINVQDVTSTVATSIISASGVEITDTSVEVSQPSVNPAGGVDITVTPRKQGTYKLILSGDSFADEEITFTSKPADSVVIVPSTATVVTSDKTISIEITNTTKNVEVISLDPDVIITPRTQDPNNKIFDITTTSTASIKPRIAVRGIGVNEEIFTPTFRAGDIIQLGLKLKKVRAGTQQTITVVGADPTRQLTAIVPQAYSSIVTCNVVDHETITVDATSEVANVPVTVGGNLVEESTIEVSFLPTSDTLTPVISSSIVNSTLPNDSTTYAGSYIVVKVSGTEEDVTFRSNSGNTVFKDGSSKYEKVITNSSVEDIEITVSGTNVDTLTIPLSFVARPVGGPQFELIKTAYSFPVTTKKFTFSVNNLEGTLKAKSTSLKVKPSVENNVVVLTLSDYVPDPISCQIILSVDGQEDRVVDINVTFPEELKTMSCDNARLELIAGETIEFSIPTKDEDDVVDIQPSSPLLVYTLDVNVVRVTSNDIGEYTLLIKHTEYKDAIVYVSVKDNTATVTPPAPLPVKEEFYDVGSAPDVSVTVNANGFYNSVMDSQLISTDDERIAYVLGNGEIGFSAPVHVLMTYAEENGPDAVFRGGDYVARQNYNIYSVIKSMLGVQNYYVFKGNLRMILKVFKKYKDGAYSLPYLLRFDEKWPGIESDLNRFKQISTWLNKYVETNGVNMGSYVASLKPYFQDSVVDNLTQFCAQNVNP